MLPPQYRMIFNDFKVQFESFSVSKINFQRVEFLIINSVGKTKHSCSMVRNLLFIF